MGFCRKAAASGCVVVRGLRWGGVGYRGDRGGGGAAGEGRRRRARNPGAETRLRAPGSCGGAGPRLRWQVSLLPSLDSDPPRPGAPSLFPSPILSP